MSNGEGLQFGRSDDLDEIVATLREGDRVIIADRTYPMEIFEKGREKIGSNPHETTVAYLEFRGRTYRLRGEYLGPGEDTTPPMLELRKEGEWSTVRTSVDRIEVESDQQIISDTRAGEWLAEVGIDVQ
ncbi:hypothetical protein [Halobellus sp. H-GB7]|uniref:hypothetical protein n=1 Tax=Halobellus sp. H-GB7 TaxID=3069756 RepID=UPI0027B29BCE|nr:hypothetical protein [Halobellus sp. H-GB7]MDQ2054308.1 hypothetical protein [Halobellus sp. H-GB7]